MTTINCELDKNGNFTMTNGGNVETHPNGKVKWKVKKKSSIEWIKVFIAPEPIIWRSGPMKKAGNSKSWKGYIVDFDIDESAEYVIIHQIKGKEIALADLAATPRISINPKKKINKE